MSDSNPLKFSKEYHNQLFAWTFAKGPPKCSSLTLVRVMAPKLTLASMARLLAIAPV
jgi:hypothetical protein